VGLLVALEGIDNVGKSSATRTLASRLRERGYLVTALSEFGTDAVGRAVRDFVDPRYRRAFATLSDPRRIVLCNRYLHTAIIYQAQGTGVAIEGMRERLRALCGETFRPADLVLLFEASVETALRRGGGNIRDRPFPEAAARSFRELSLGGRTVIIDAEASQEDVAAACLRAILDHARPVTRVSVPALALAQRRSHHAREVLFVPQAASTLYLQRKPTYPEGVYRIAGGGVEAEETPLEALVREFEEEAGLSPGRANCRLLTTLVYNAEVDENAFVSYLYEVRLGPGQEIPPTHAADGSFVSWRGFSPRELPAAAAKLRAAGGWRSGWGGFRAAAVDAFERWQDRTGFPGPLPRRGGIDRRAGSLRSR